MKRMLNKAAVGVLFALALVQTPANASAHSGLDLTFKFQEPGQIYCIKAPCPGPHPDFPFPPVFEIPPVYEFPPIKFPPVGQIYCIKAPCPGWGDYNPF